MRPSVVINAWTERKLGGHTGEVGVNGQCWQIGGLHARTDGSARSNG